MPSEWVLKPQREGGGNNLYGEELREVIMILMVGVPSWLAQAEHGYGYLRVVRARVESAHRIRASSGPGMVIVSSCK